MVINPYTFVADGGAPFTSTADTDAVLMNGEVLNWVGTNHFQYFSSGTWSTGTNNPLDRNLLDGGGNYTNCVAIAGDESGSYGTNTNFTVWSGSSWSTSTAIGTATSLMSAGGNSDGAQWAGGTYSALDDNQTWNGSSWTSQTALTSGRRSHQGDGNDTGAYVVGGTGASTDLFSMEIWDGTATSWSAGGTFPTVTDKYPRGYGGGAWNMISTTAETNSGMYVYDEASSTWSYAGATTPSGNAIYAMCGGADDNVIKIGHAWAATACDLWNGSTFSATGALVTGVSAGACGANT